MRRPLPDKSMRDIAARINDHLARIEADIGPGGKNEKGLYFHAGAWWPGGGKIGITYISYQLSWFLDKERALSYLKMLDGGETGKHFDLLPKEREKA